MNKSIVRSVFPHEPTEQQLLLFEEIHRFLVDEGDRIAFVLKGYAGTGKTTSVSALVKLLPKYTYRSVLLAPTGRAAKVVASYSSKTAYTIHKRIYRKQETRGQTKFVLNVNTLSDTIFIVDEASMITNESDKSEIWGKGVLADLIQFVYSGKNCKLLLIGDTAQLPPVGSDYSPALDSNYLINEFDLNLTEFELTEVLRQQKESGILRNATEIRNLVRNEVPAIPQIITKGYTDCYQCNGERLPDGLQYAYDKFGIENTLLVCRSNKSANGYNQQIRARILYREEEISTNDYLMVVRNNYYWLPEKSEIGFIANGDIVRIRKIKGFTEIHGCRFADLVVELCDYDNLEVECKIILDTLVSESPSLSSAESQMLYESVLEDYAYLPNKRERFKKLKEDPFYNALQVKFAYAVTCHKAQGGQWDAVFIDQGYLNEQMINQDFLRWMYTAVTRATKELYFVNFSDKFFAQ